MSLKNFLLSKKNALLVAGIYVALGFLLYGTSLSNGFIDYDDPRLIIQNPLIRTFSFSTVKTIFTTYEAVLYVPLLFLSYQIDFFAGGIDPFVFHLHSLLLHIVNALLVAALINALSKKSMVAILCGLLFLVHPLNVETVAWASARKDLLAAFFFLLCLLTYIGFLRKNDRRRYCASIVLFLLGLISKPSIIALPFLLLLIDRREKRKMSFSLIAEKIPFFFLSAAAASVGFFGPTQATRFGTTTLFEKILMAFKSLSIYLEKIFWPEKLSLFYPQTDPITMASSDFLWPIIAMTLLGIVLVLLRKKFPELLFGGLWFLIILLPTFPNFQIGEDFGDLFFAADRYTYLPAIGIFFAVTVFLSRFLRGEKAAQRSVIATGAAMMIICIFFFLSFQQSQVWKDNFSVFSNAVKQYPNSQAAHANLGAYFWEQGLANEAIRSYEQSLSIRPTLIAYVNLGQAYLNAGRYDDAIASFEEVLKMNAVHAPAQLNIGVAYAQKGEFQKALDAFEKTAEIDPLSPLPYLNIGLIRELLQEWDEAAAAFQKALQSDPGNQIALEGLSRVENPPTR